jgi:hypothetical protein
MAVLSLPERESARFEFVERSAEHGGYTDLSREQIREVFQTVDSQIDASATTLNQWFPVPQRSVLSSRAKAFVLSILFARRALRA